MIGLQIAKGLNAQALAGLHPHILFWFVMILALLAADPLPASSQNTISKLPALEEADLSAWLDGFVPYALTTGDIAGAQVVVVKDGKVLLAKGFGYSDVAAKVPMEPDRTMMLIGSTSKLFTWTAVMQLVEQGKIELDVDISQYLDFTLSIYQVLDGVIQSAE